MPRGDPLRALVAVVGATLLAVGTRWPGSLWRIDQWHALLLGSAWVLLWARPAPLGAWRWVIAWSWPVVVVFRDAFGVAWLMGATWTLVGLAAAWMDARYVKTAVLAAAWWQVPWIAWQLGGGHALLWFDGAGSGWWGTVGGRAPVSALLGLAALWTAGGQRWWWWLLAVGSQSWLGVVPVAAQWWWRARGRGWWLAGAALVGYATWPAWGVKVSSRWRVWTAALPHTWPPVGCGTVRGAGFLGDGLTDRLLSWVDYHNTLLEAWARTGPWALLLIGGLVWWSARRCGPWVTCWVLVVAGSASWAAYPVLAWLTVLALTGGRDGVGDLSRHGEHAGRVAPAQ